MPDEIPATEVPPPAAVPPENPTAENLPPAAPPPAASLVVHGVKSERELELEKLLADKESALNAAQRKLLEREREIAEREREIQTLREIPKPKKNKRSLMENFLHGDDDDE